MTRFPRIYKDQDLRDLCDLANDYDLLGRTFHGAVKTREAFVDFMSGNQTYGVMHEGEIVGFTWLNQYTGRAVAIHVCLFPGATSHKVKVELGKAFVKYQFGRLCDEDGKPLFDTLVAMIPETYQHVVRYVYELGFEYTGKVPHGLTVQGETQDMILMCKTREED